MSTCIQKNTLNAPSATVSISVYIMLVYLFYSVYKLLHVIFIVSNRIDVLFPGLKLFHC